MERGFNNRSKFSTMAKSPLVMSPELQASATVIRSPLAINPAAAPPTDGVHAMPEWRRAVQQWSELHDVMLNSQASARKKEALLPDERALHLRAVLTGLARTRADRLTVAQLVEYSNDKDRVIGTLPTGLQTLVDTVDPPNEHSQAARRANKLFLLFSLRRAAAVPLHSFLNIFEDAVGKLALEGFNVDAVSEVLGYKLLDAAYLPENTRNQLMLALLHEQHKVNYDKVLETLRGMRIDHTRDTRTHQGSMRDSNTKSPCPACNRTDHWAPKFRGYPAKNKSNPATSGDQRRPEGGTMRAQHSSKQTRLFLV